MWHIALWTWSFYEFAFPGLTSCYNRCREDVGVIAELSINRLNLVLHKLDSLDSAVPP